MFRWLKSRKEKEREEYMKLVNDDDEYDPNDISEEDDDEYEEESEDELEAIDYDYMDGVPYDEMKEKYRGQVEPEGWDAVIDDRPYGGRPLKCLNCQPEEFPDGFGVAWKDDGNAECWCCDSQYKRAEIFDIMGYDPPLKKCLRCNQPYPQCVGDCPSVSKQEKDKRGLDYDD